MSTRIELKKIVLSVGLAAIATAGVSSCALDDRASFDTEAGNPKGAGVGGKADAWAAADSPFIFDPNVNIKYSELPKAGEAAVTPWASSYWPYYEDSINHRWDGEDTKSAAQKFEDAYSLSGVEDGVSREHGVESQSHRTACTTDDECDDDKVEACAIREGEEAGFCIPTWFGICPAWAGAAVTLAEPEHPVEFQGQTFKINDIKALVSVSHERVGSKFVSLRCNTNPDDIELDADGRPTSNSCRFTNPATYHILLANYLGLRKQAFVEDRTFSAEVWNQPIRGFKIDDEREVSIAEANELIGVQPDNVVKVTEAGAAKKDEWKHFGPYQVNGGDSINVAMTGNNDADLHVRLDGEPTDSDFNCRPFGDNTVETCNLVASANSTEFFVSVKGFADSSDFELKIEHGSVPTTYKFNAKATKLRYVKNTVSWIAESASTTNGNLADRIDSFTRTDTYEYILELNDAGDLIGGEWVGSSKTNHPDFVWLPTTLSTSSRVASGKIKWGDVKKIYEMSIETDEPAGESRWDGNGSIISMTSDTDTGFGLDKDMSRVHPGNANPAVFFQWEIDGRDGRKLEIAGEGSATITYGSWSDRASDRVFKNVTLPFVLDPTNDGKSAADGQYYVIAVQYSSEPSATTDVSATATSAAGTTATSEAARGFDLTVDGHTWNGNASIISHSSGTKTGYGLNYDVANIHPASDKNPVVFYQWEVSAADGKTLEISADGMSTATITYGTWADRNSDVTRTVTLPHTIDPQADGKETSDGTWYVVKVAFDAKPAVKTAVMAATPNADPQ
tara:strand:- start:59179 stop:61554 length:2376 start_codon:yes stop_codon:yes gene_type:complete